MTSRRSTLYVGAHPRYTYPMPRKPYPQPYPLPGLRVDHSGPHAYSPDELARAVMAEWPLPEPPPARVPLKEAIARAPRAVDPYVHPLTGAPLLLPEGTGYSDAELLERFPEGLQNDPPEALRQLKPRREHRATAHRKPAAILALPLRERRKPRWVRDADREVAARDVEEMQTVAGRARVDFRYQARRGGPLWHMAKQKRERDHPKVRERAQNWYYFKGGMAKARDSARRRKVKRKRAREQLAQELGLDVKLAQAQARDQLRRAWRRAVKAARKKRVGGWD